MNAISHSHFCPETGPPLFRPNCAERRALRAVFDFPHLVLKGMNPVRTHRGESETRQRAARQYVAEEVSTLLREGNTDVLEILAKYGLEEAQTALRQR